MRTRSIVRAASLVTVGVIALAACSNSTKSGTGLNANSGSSSGAGAGGNSNQTYKIGFQGPLSGDNQQLGINIVNGEQLAIDQANAKGDLGFKLEIVKSDDGGVVDKSSAAAQALMQDNAVMGVIGPAFSGPTKAVGATYAQAGLALISASATNGALTSQGFTTFHRIVPPDSVEGTQAADWLAKKNKKVFVIDDTTEYGKGVSDDVQKELKAKGVTVTRQGIAQSASDYNSISRQVVSSGASAMFYGGYDAQAAKFAKALTAAGYTGIRMSGNGGKSSVFTTGAGTAGNGFYFSCGCLDATVAPDAKSFTTAYTAAFKQPPSTYSPEGYDATNAMIQAIKAAKGKGAVTRQSVEEAVKSISYKGITTTITFQPNGEVQQQVVNLYQQKNGKIGLVGDIKAQG